MANQVNKDAIVRFLAGYEADLSKAKVENGTVYFALKPDPLDSTKTIGSIYVDADGKRILMSGESLAILDAMGEKILTKYIKSVDFGNNTGAQGKLTYTKGDGSDVDINVPSASASAAGFVTTGAQTFAGIKTFNNPLIPLQGSYIHQAPGTGGTSGYVKIATFTISGSYQNIPIIIELVDRVRKGSCVLNIQFQNVNSSDPALATFTYEGVDYNCYMHKSTTSTWDLYVQKGEAHGYPTVVRFHKAPYMSKVAVTWTNVQAEAVPSGATKAALGGNVAYASKAGSADTATKDGSGNNIQTTYLKDITSQTSTSDFKFWGLKGNGGDATVITIPAATNALAGLMTTGDQSFAGTKTFAGFVYGGMSKSTANAARKLWFMSGTTGTPTYSDDLTYNPSTKTLVAPYVTGLASQATGDGQGNEILTTYLKDIVGTTSTTKYTIKGVLGNGGDGPTTVEIPAASTSVAGLVTTGSQTFKGTKTFRAFRYSYIAENTDLTTAQPIWFDSATKGTPVYNSDLTYTPSTNTLKASNFDGLASKATADGNGTNIRDNYLTSIENTNTDKHILTAVKGNGNTVDVPLGFVLKAGDTMSGQLKLTGGLWINTSTASKPIVIDRTGSNKEKTTIYQNDNGLNFELLNDEATAGVYYTFAATDDEANAGAGAFSNKTASIVANKNGVTITATNFSGLASKATADSAGNNILDKYISDLGISAHTANSFKIKAYDGSGNDQREIALPVDTTGALASLIINGAQTILGAKTFTGAMTVQGASNFNYDGIESATSDSDRVVWFAHANKKGTPVYHNDFTYNPAKKILKVANITGTVTNATKDSEGNIILDKYLSSLAITSHTANDWAFTAYNGRGNDVATINAPVDTTGALATLVINGAQTFKGSKTFSSDVVLSGTNTNITKEGSSVSWYQGRDNAIIKTTSFKGYNTAYSLKTTDGAWSAGVYNDNILYWSYVTDAHYNASTNTKTADMSLTAAGRLNVPSILASTRIGIGAENTNYGLYNAKTTYLADKLTVAANATVDTLTIANTSGVAHIAFSRGSYNYITSPADSTIAFVPNGLSVGSENSHLLITTNYVQPGKTNAYYLGASGKRWKNIYGNAVNISGTATLSGAVNIGGNLAVTGTTTLSNTLTVAKATTLQAALTVTGVTTLNSMLYANAGIEVKSNIIPVEGDLTQSVGNGIAGKGWMFYGRLGAWHPEKVQRPTSANITARGDDSLSYFVATSSMTTGKPTVGDSHIIHLEWDNTGAWTGQIALPTSKSQHMQWRTQGGSADWSTAGNWRSLIDSENYTTFLNDTYVNVSGDTMTGNLTVNGGTGVTVKNTLKAKYGFITDNLSIGAQNTGYSFYNNGTSYFVDKVYLTYNTSIVQEQRETSNYTTSIQWVKVNPSTLTYKPHIGQHNTGGNTSDPGMIAIVPYATSTDPWSKGVGLAIQKGAMWLDGKEVFTANSWTSMDSHNDARYVNVTGDTMTGTLNGTNFVASTKITTPILFASNYVTIGSENANYGLYNAKTTYLVDTVNMGATLTVTGATSLRSTLSVTGNATFSGTITAAKQIYTSFKNAVATGSYQAGAATIQGLVDEVRYSSGVVGSVSLTAEYISPTTKEKIPAGWYNFEYLPHRSGGANGAASGDNHQYGTLLLYGMTLNSQAWRIRIASGAIAEVRRIWNDGDTLKDEAAQVVRSTYVKDVELTVSTATDKKSSRIYLTKVKGNGDTATIESLSNRLHSHDIRNYDPTPNKTPLGLYLRFSQGANHPVIKNIENSTYLGIASWRSYGGGVDGGDDLSGGQPMEIAYTQQGSLWTRVGKDASTWNSWVQLLSSANYTRTLDPIYVNVSGDTMTGDLTVPNLIAQTKITTPVLFASNYINIGSENANYGLYNIKTSYFGDNVTVEGLLYATAGIYSNRGTAAIASLWWNKGGTNWGGIGYNAVSNENYFGPCGSDGQWKDAETDTWTFKGKLKTTNDTIINGTLRIDPILGNWQEGIRIAGKDDEWITIALGTTADSGTHAKQWAIHRKNDGNFCIAHGESTGTSGLFINTSNNVGIGTISPSYKLHVTGDIYANGGWLRTSGPMGWYNESYGGGWYMTESTWIRNYGNKSLYMNTATVRTDLIAGGSWIVGSHDGAFQVRAATTGSAGSFFQSWFSGKTPSGSWGIGPLAGYNDLYFVYGTDTNYNANNNVTANIKFGADGKVWGAVWNDYAEFRQAETVEPGRVVVEHRSGKMKLSTERLQPGANVISDTYGFTIGQTDKCQTPIAVAGRVLVYPYENIDIYELGDAVCSGPNGTVSKMTREEIWKYPERIIGTVSEIPTYKTWGSGNVKVNGRIWIKVK